MAELARESRSMGAALALGAGVALAPIPALAIGPETVPLALEGWAVVTCPVGVPKNTECVQVKATAAYISNKPAYNSEVFGRVRLPDGESALYGDFAEASDAGKIADIPSELTKDNPQVTFMMKLVPGAGSTDLEFVNLKTRTYPGMRADFRVVAPVSDTEGEFECEDAQYGLDCPEQLPF